MTATERRQPEYKAHPAAELFPMMTGDDWDRFVKDIADKGLVHPIVLYHGQILDGRNRYAACLQTGREPLFIDQSDITDPYAFVVSLNIERRHLTTSQRAAIGAEIAEHYVEDGRRRQLANLDLGRSRKRDLHELEEPQGRAVVRAANQMRVGQTGVTQAMRVKREAPDLFEKVKSGELLVTVADRQRAKRKEAEEEGIPPMPSPTPMPKRRTSPQTIAKSDPDMGPVLEVFKQIRDVILEASAQRAGELINGLEEIRIVAASRDLGEWVSKMQVSRADHVRLTGKGD